MSKHTPPPWHYALSFTGSPYVQRGDEGGMIIEGLTRDRALADARLIAKAPEMYELLKRMEGAGYRKVMDMREVEKLLKEIDDDNR